MPTEHACQNVGPSRPIRVPAMLRKLATKKNLVSFFKILAQVSHVILIHDGYEYIFLIRERLFKESS